MDIQSAATKSSQFRLLSICLVQKEGKKLTSSPPVFYKRLYYLQYNGRGLNDVRRLRMTSYARLTLTQNRSRFPQAYTRYFLHCNKHFVHTFLNMAYLELRDLAAEREWP